MAHVLDAVFEEAVRLSVLAEGRHQELVRNFVSKERLNTMEQKLQSIDTTVQGYQQQFANLQKLVRDSHSRLTVGLPQHMNESKSLFFSLSLFLSPIFLPSIPFLDIDHTANKNHRGSHIDTVPPHGLSPVHFHLFPAPSRSVLRRLQTPESKCPQEILVDSLPMYYPFFIPQRSETNGRWKCPAWVLL